MRWVRAKTYHRVIVHTTLDQTFDGVLASECRDGLVLRAAALVDNQGRVPLSGDTFIPRDKIAFIQAPPAVA